MNIIFLLVRGGSERYPQPLWTPYVEKDEEGNEVVWQTDDQYELENKLKELLYIHSKESIRPMSDLSWLVEVVLEG